MHLDRMAGKFAFALVLLLSLLGASTAAQAAIVCPSPPKHTLEATQPFNIGELKLAVLRYACSGAYEQDIAKVAGDAQAYVEQRASQVNKPALVLDIDETSLSNWDEIHANDFGYIPDGACDLLPKGPCGVHAWELSARGEVIAPTLKLFNAAKAKGVVVFFITGRTSDDEERAATVKNLEAAGYTGWAALIMRTAAAGRMTATEYKSLERAKIAAQGYTIIANMGDQNSDLDGGHSERRFRLPNPFYFIP